MTVTSSRQMDAHPRARRYSYSTCSRCTCVAVVSIGASKKKVLVSGTEALLAIALRPI